jgi:hypothetical protein
LDFTELEHFTLFILDIIKGNNRMREDVSAITGGSLLLVLCLGFLLLALPRRYAFVPMLIAGCYLTLGQVLIIGGLHFYLIRILIFFGMVRVFVRGEIFSIKMTSIDKVLVAWLMVSSFLYVLFSGADVVLTERMGGVYNTLGIYFFARALIWNLDDIVFNVRMLVIIIIPLAVLFAVEHTTGRNPFSFLGGVPEITGIREGQLRCQGPFRHPILAGTFGATAMPLFVGLWVYSGRGRILAACALLSATTIVITSSSSGPALAYLFGLFGLICWPFRRNMRAIRWGIVGLLVTLHVYMKAPVWFLISRVGDLIGGGGWYRSALIDAAIHHFDEWWLIGTARTAHWMPTGLAIDPNVADITNQFIAQGVNGGLLAMILFIWLIVKCFKTIGVSVLDKSHGSFSERFMIWSLGCTILGHVASFFSVSYFDQIIIFWYMSIAMIAALAYERKVEEYESEQLEDPGLVQFPT